MYNNEHFPKIRSVRAACASLGVPGTALALAVLLLLAGCGEGQGAKAPAPAEDSPEQKVAQLEASGAIPQLDRLPTVAGIDANGDGVRDDIELYIEKTYADPAQRRAAMQMARAYQRMLLVDKNDAVALQAVSEQSFRAVACLKFAFPGTTGRVASARMMENVRAVSTNTKERLQAYLAHNKAQSGSVSVPPEGNTCE